MSHKTAQLLSMQQCSVRSESVLLAYERKRVDYELNGIKNGEAKLSNEAIVVVKHPGSVFYHLNRLK